MNETLKLKPACDRSHSLVRLVGSFRRGMLGKHESDMMCAKVCYPLQAYLSMLGYKTEIVEADFGQMNHVWLELPCGCIIDPTADQFSGPLLKLPKVYIGPLPDIYARWIRKTSERIAKN